MRKIFLFIPLLAFLAVGVFLFRGLFMDPSKLPSALIDKPIPTFSLPSLYEPEQMLTADSLKGEVALLNVWATWCPTCLEEHGQLNKIAQEEGVTIYGLNYKDEPDKALRWLERYYDPYKLVVVDQAGSLGLDMGVYGAPETFILDRRGVIRYRHVGAVDEAVWQKLRSMMQQIEKEEV
ncbi:DsbE family thiol:disulfide interchange protein [Nitrincola alkalilacustris]|uniref:DsbE family thiol:disulfide interchange protein n=1 Tax=Nitrincola alkalilacustris TaxID=1571224 RepID=UPI00124F6A28|nr:DsbE family thiol:disulfide interchange protein [Nitrincola alkalilacustris]